MSELYLKKFSARTDRGELQEIFGFSNVERVTVFDVKAIDMEDDAGEMIIESLTGKIQVKLEDGENVTGTITGKFNGEFLEIDAQFNQNFDEEDMVVEMLNAENFEFIGALQGAHPSMESVTKPSDMEKLLSNSESLMDGEKNISKNINVTITVEGKYCSGSCQFIDLNGPWCSLFSKEQQLSNDAISELLRCKQCLKTFGEEDSTTEEKNISKNINVTIKLDGEYCSPSCQFFIDGDFSAPLCALSGDELELTNGAEDILRCNKCLKTFGKDGDLKASVKTNKGSLLSKSEYDPEEDMEWTEEDEENEYDLDDVEKINKQVQRVMVKVLNRHRDEITIAMNAWMEKVVAEGTVPDELSEAIEYAIEFQLDNITEMPTDGVVR